MSKVAKRVGSRVGQKMKKVGGGSSGPLSPVWQTTIPAGQATPAPPLGTLLGERGVNVAQFCKQFNSTTDHIKTGVPLPTTVTVKPDRTFDIRFELPPVNWFLMRAAGIRRVEEREEYDSSPPIGKVSLKHIYHIAELLKTDPKNDGVPMVELCHGLIRTGLTMGIHTVKEFDAEEHSQFQKERKQTVDEELKAIAEARAAAVLRTGNV